MYLSLFTSLWLLYLAQAGQTPLDFNFGANFCSVPEKEVLVVLSEECRGNHLHTKSCDHHEQPKISTVPTAWTQEPKCMPNENSTITYCVYTNDTFANGRGISFFTSPSIAKKVTALPAFTNKSLYNKVNVFDNPPWEVREIPRRGRGLFATRILERGDPIVATTPVGVYLSDALSQDFALDYIYLHTAFIHLPKPTQQLFLSSMAQSQGDPIMERININAFAGDFEGAPHFLMYPETARMNHDCRPNAMYYYDPTTLIHSTMAARTINPGEEITIPYDNILRPRSERQKGLNEHWGFECSCSLCSGSESEVAASDARIEEILELQIKLANWSPWSAGTPAMAEMLISLYEEERLHAAKATGHTFAALAYNAVGDKMMAEWHAELALEAGMVNSGPNDDVTAMKNLLEDPEAHWSWLARKQKREL